MELVELEFPGHTWPWVMNSKVLLISKPGAGKSGCSGICWCLLLSISEEFQHSFVAEISNQLLNRSKQSCFVVILAALRVSNIDTHGVVVHRAQRAWKEKDGPFLLVFAMGKGIEEWAGKPVVRSWCWEA